MAVHATQPFDCQAVSLVVSRTSRHSASFVVKFDTLKLTIQVTKTKTLLYFGIVLTEYG